METTILTAQVIPANIQTEAMDLLKQSFTLLMPYLQALTPEDRKRMLKMNDGTEPFVTKGIEYVHSNAEFVPAFMSEKDLVADYATFAALAPFKHLLIEYYSLVSDSRMVAGSSAFTNLLSYYNSVKLAAAKRVPGAKNVYDDLKKRFLKKKLKRDHVLTADMIATDLNKVA